MRILFFDTVGWQYTVDTPLQSPMGGSQSAMCYLAVELVKRGHEVRILNGNSASVETKGVICSSQEDMTAELANGYDVMVALNAPFAAHLKRGGVKIPMVQWWHHGHDQPATGRLKGEPDEWDAVVFPSERQSGTVGAVCNIAPEACHVIGNGISPAFEELELPRPWFVTGERPVLFYTSTPFRGLDVLLMAWPEIKEAIPEAILHVYSSMQVYRAESDPHGALYAMARNLKGVRYFGSLGQRELADRLCGSAALAHPSTFAEMQSIAALEAMAVGAEVLTTDYGGQRETTGSLLRAIPYSPHIAKADLAKTYAKFVIKALREIKDSPQAALEKRERILSHVKENHLWSLKAAQWEKLLGELAHARA